MDDYDQSPPEDVPGPAPDADTKRRRLTLTERYAASICHLAKADPDTGILIPVIDPDWARRQTPSQIVATFERWHCYDHRIALGLGGTNHPTNIDPLPRLEHEAVKTPADLTKIAKTKRLSKEQEAFRAVLLAKHQGEPRPAPPKRKSAPMKGTKASGWRHRIDGTWERR